MTSVCAASLLAAAGGSGSLAQPVARHLIDDANVVEVLYTEQSGPSATPFGSMHLLDDYNGDGVREILLTHVVREPSPGPYLVDFFQTAVRSPLGDTTFVELPPVLGTTVLELAVVSALQIRDIDGDGVRDIAVSRGKDGRSVLLRVYSGATGEVIREASASDPTFPWGLSLTVIDEGEGESGPVLLAGFAGRTLPAAEMYCLWSVSDNVVTPYLPKGNSNSVTDFAIGVTILDLGVGATGARELVATISNPSSPTTRTGVYRYGRDPLAVVGALLSNGANPVQGRVDAGAALIADLDGDGFHEIVCTGRASTADAPEAFGLPIFEGAATDQPSGVQTLEPVAVHQPRIVIDRGAGPEIVEPLAEYSLIGLEDVTGDGVNDYAFLGTVRGDLYEAPCAVVACGRTGRAVMAARADSDDFAPEVRFTRSYSHASDEGKHAIVSPGDIDGDGAADLQVLVVRSDLTIQPPIREQLLLTHYLPTPCVGDVDFDRVVNFSDLNAVLSDFGMQGAMLAADLNADGVVNFADLNLVLSAFGAQCE